MRYIIRCAEGVVNTEFVEALKRIVIGKPVTTWEYHPTVNRFVIRAGAWRSYGSLALTVAKDHKVTVSFYPNNSDSELAYQMQYARSVFFSYFTQLPLTHPPLPRLSKFITLFSP